ncbi:MAG: ATP-binding cassette domain-containing protein [Actinomycetota bacterium]
MDAIVTQQLTRRFGDVVAVDHIDLTVHAGEIFGLLGPNGAGKTSTIKMLITLLEPTSGSAIVAGHDVKREPRAVRRSIGYVPQLLSSDSTLSGYENLLIFSRLYHVPRRERARRIEEALEFAGLQDARHRLVRTYSGGMIRRLEVAQSLIHRPLVLFLDEPTVGLDPIARRGVWDQIRSVRDREGRTVLLTTHHMDEAEELCDRVAIMHLGRIAAIGSVEELKRSVGEGVSLDDVFTRYTGASISSGGGYRDTARARRTARRMG